MQVQADVLGATVIRPTVVGPIIGAVLAAFVYTAVYA